MGVHYIIGRARIPMKVLKKLSPSYPQSARSRPVPADSGSVPTNLATKIRRKQEIYPSSYLLLPFVANIISGSVPTGCNKITTDRWAFPLFSATYLSLPSPAHASSGEDMEICLRGQRKSLLVDELEEPFTHNPAKGYSPFFSGPFIFSFLLRSIGTEKTVLSYHSAQIAQ